MTLQASELIFHFLKIKFLFRYIRTIFIMIVELLQWSYFWFALYWIIWTLKLDFQLRQNLDIERWRATHRASILGHSWLWYAFQAINFLARSLTTRGPYTYLVTNVTDVIFVRFCVFDEVFWVYKSFLHLYSIFIYFKINLNHESIFFTVLWFQF